MKQNKGQVIKLLNRYIRLNNKDGIKAMKERLSHQYGEKQSKLEGY